MVSEIILLQAELLHKRVGIENNTVNLIYYINGYTSYIPKSVFFEHRFLVDEHYSKN